jgi:hypothetical protein
MVPRFAEPIPRSAAERLIPVGIVSNTCSFAPHRNVAASCQEGLTDRQSRPEEIAGEGASPMTCLKSNGSVGKQGSKQEARWTLLEERNIPEYALRKTSELFGDFGIYSGSFARVVGQRFELLGNCHVVFLGIERAVFRNVGHWFDPYASQIAIPPETSAARFY